MSRKVNFPNLDGLRFIAFFFVFCSHAIILPVMLAANTPFTTRLFNTILSGASGVSIFFVLSGFLITYLIIDEKEKLGRLAIGQFYMRRVLRIWPLYYAVVIFAFIVYPMIKVRMGIHSDLSSHPIYYFLFLSNFDRILHEIPGKTSMSGNVTWSVAVEEQFYLVWPLLMAFTNRRTYPLVFIGTIIVSIVFKLTHTHDHTSLYYHSLSVCGDLAVGGLSAYLCIYTRLPQRLAALSKLAIGLIYLGGLALVFWSDLLFGILSPSICTLFYAFVILEQNYARHSLFKLSTSRFMSFWGKYTYGLYLLHPIALLVFDTGFRMSGHSDYVNSFSLLCVYVVGTLLLSLGLSYVSYEFYEKKFLRLKDRFTPVRRPHHQVELNKV